MKASKRTGVELQRGLWKRDARQHDAVAAIFGLKRRMAPEKRWDVRLGTGKDKRGNGDAKHSLAMLGKSWSKNSVAAAKL